jgi:hypothetical protein
MAAMELQRAELARIGGENCSNCAADCGCPSGKACNSGVCQPVFGTCGSSTTCTFVGCDWGYLGGHGKKGPPLYFAADLAPLSGCSGHSVAQWMTDRNCFSDDTSASVMAGNVCIPEYVHCPCTDDHYPWMTSAIMSEPAACGTAPTNCFCTPSCGGNCGLCPSAAAVIRCAAWAKAATRSAH